MTPVKIGDATLYCGDAREWLSEAPECFRVDAVLTDPPYGIGYGKYLTHEDDPKAYADEVVACLAETRGKVKDGWCAIYQAAKTAPQWGTWFGSDFRPIAMPKTFTQVFPGKWPIAATDYVLLWQCGAPKWPIEGGRVRDWYVQQTADMSLRETRHPCARPLCGVEYVLSHCAGPSSTVFDPYMGSGTTGVACANLGRKFVGIEIEPRYFDIACERIEAAYAQLRLFA